MNSTSICPNGPLILGYGVDYFPYVYEQFDGNFNGIFLDLFRVIARKYGCTGVELRKFSSQRITSDYVLFDGEIDSGEVFTAIDTSFLRLSDVKRYRYSTTAIRTKMLFVERKRNSGGTSDLTFYAVFPANIFVSIVAGWLIYGAIDLLHSKVFLSTFDLLHRLMNQYFLVFVFLIHSSYFNGNNLVTSPFSTTPFSSLAIQFRSGLRKIVLSEGDQPFNDNETEIFLGSNSTMLTREYVDECFELVCEDSTRVGLFYEPDMFSFYSNKSMSSACTLAEIVLPKGLATGVSWLAQSVNNGDAYNFLINRNHSRKVMDTINFALLTVYNPDNNPVLFSHYVEWEYNLAAAQYKERQAALASASFSQISFNHLEIPLIILGIGLAISLGAFIVEHVYGRMRKTIGKISVPAVFEMA